MTLKLSVDELAAIQSRFPMTGKISDQKSPLFGLPVTIEQKDGDIKIRILFDEQGQQHFAYHVFENGLPDTIHIENDEGQNIIQVDPEEIHFTALNPITALNPRILMQNGAIPPATLDGTLLCFYESPKSNVSPKKVDGYFRIIMNFDGKLSGSMVFSDSVDSEGMVYRCSALAGITLKGKRYNLLFVKPYESLVLHALEPVSYDDAKMASSCVSILFTYLTGVNRFGITIDEFYEKIDSKTPSWRRYYSGNKKEPHTIYVPLPIDYSSRMKWIYKEGEAFPPVLPKVLIESMVNVLLTNESLFRSISIILEAHLLPKGLSGAAYAIALETITSNLIEKCDRLERNSKIKPLDKTIWTTSVLPALKETINGTLKSVSPPPENIEKLTTIYGSRIQNINAPTNKDKLIIPFQENNIELNTEDLEAIEMRNKFLHGSKLDLRQDIEEWKKYHYIEIRLLTLLNLLILSNLGYKGPVWNWVKIHAAITGLGNSEDEVRNI